MAGREDTMPETQDLARGASKHNNVITLRSPDIEKIDYIVGSFAISEGQPSDLPPIIKEKAGVWTVNINCGRHKTPPIADAFVAICGGKDYVYNKYAISDRVPDELNFYLGVQMKLKAGGQAAALNLYIAQGSNIGNNWWIGSTGIANRNSSPRIIPIIGYDSRLNTFVTRQVYEIAYQADNDIQLHSWI